MSAALYNEDGQWGIPGFLWPAVLGISVAIHISVLIYGLPDMSFGPDEPTPPHETEVIIESGGLTFAPVQAIESAPSQSAVPSVAPVVSPSEPPQPVSSQTVVTARPVQGQTLRLANAEASRPDIPRPSTVQVSQAADAAKTQEIPVIAAPVTPAKQPQNLAVRPVEPVTASAQQVKNLEPSLVVSAVQAPSGGLIAQPTVSTVTPAVSLITPVAGPESGAVAVTQITNVVVSPPQTVASSAVPGTDETSVSKAGAPSAVVQVESGTAQAVKPVEQQIAALRPAEEEVTAIAPSRPETSTVPAASQASDPAQGVAPVEVASIDPLAKVSGYVASYDPGECSHLTVTSAGAHSAAVTAYGAGIAPFAVFDQRFAADQGYEAKIEVRLVTRQQCALLDALGLSEGIEAAGLVELDRTIVLSGTNVSGVVQRDLPLDRIAAAQAAGVPLSGIGSPELYLIDDGGQIHDGRGYILPASNAVTAGGWRFSVPVTLLSKQESETALVLAIWNRPEASQPARFANLPAGRIAEVLAAPGVYSLTAFKVSR